MSLAQNVDALFFSEHGALRDEFGFLYASIFRKAEKHLKIVEALSRRKCGMTREELAAAAGQKPGGNFKTRLEELEQCDFIRKYLPPDRAKKGAMFRLVDNFTIFHYAFAASRTEHDRRLWTSSANTPGMNAWRGLAFERVCLQHVEQIKRALGISGVRTSVYTWRSSSSEGKEGAQEEKEAQIDLVIDRADGVINLCEIKYTRNPYEIDAEEAARLENRKDAFVRETGTKKTCMTTIVSSSGIKQTKYRWSAEAVVTLDDLFGD